MQPRPRWRNWQDRHQGAVLVNIELREPDHSGGYRVFGIGFGLDGRLECFFDFKGNDVWNTEFCADRRRLR